ncbi:uncharacterized protein LOC123522808 [Mercenaria mercenaria]|uniref:uncharacterized protein LOC123522808 n=1 Tax=Mercenaria mercenaria TaxID=6596 RepID=UPI00234E88B8|nr:uncharacterized protein LOC123522808 [Mercenaria mercenaria]
MASLNAQQKRALEFVSGGHNLVLLGPAGTGKSFLVNRVVEICSTTGKQCAVTATTGIACSVYPAQLKPMTIHRWSGIGDGRYGSSEMKRTVKNNVRYKDVMDRISNTDVLIIDECSMLSKRLLETLHEVCSLKHPQLYFGGIQVILVGDFVQLPPVPCARYNEDGSYCFESDIYRAAFPHHIILKDVIRQKDKLMVEAIREISLVFDPRKNKVVATREQLPLKPAYALTIQVDCRDIFKPGQLGVAIGRARSLDGLRVINFNKNACIKQPEKIQRFLTLEDSIETKDDRSCCNNYASLRSDNQVKEVMNDKIIMRCIVIA